MHQPIRVAGLSMARMASRGPCNFTRTPIGNTILQIWSRP
jgi:hypothetical protein